MSPTESEKRLYAAMLHAMAMDLYTPYAIVNLPGGTHEYGPRQTEQGRKGFVREDFCHGDFEKAFALLAKFGLVAMINRDGSPASASSYTGRFALAIDLDDAILHVRKHFSERVPTLDEMLTGFVGVGSFNGFLSTGRTPFMTKPEYLPVLQLLAEHGYLGRIGDKFRWTDKAAPAMRAGYHWDEDDQSSADLHDAHLDDIWNSMPLDLKKEIFFNGDTDVFLFAAAYSSWLDDGKWRRPDPKTELADGHGGGFGIVQQLEERFVLPMRGGSHR